jgi:2'-5' RNA ligase
MHGVVSLLDDKHYATVENLWAEFRVKFGLYGVRATPFPHFSYHVAEHYDLDVLASSLKTVAETTSRFHIKTTGLGIFTGASPVLYIPVVRNPELTELQRHLWSEVSKVATGGLTYYHPESWMPHITIAQGDIDHERLPDVVRLLSERDFSWDIDINNLAIIHDSGTEQILRLRFSFIEGL